MSAELHLKITKVDGTTGVYPCTPVVIAAFEREKKRSFVSALTGDVEMLNLYWLAWKAEQVAFKAAGKIIKPQMDDAWLEELRSVEPEEVDVP